MKEIIEELGFSVLGVLTVIAFVMFSWIAHLSGIDMGD